MSSYHSSGTASGDMAGLMSLGGMPDAMVSVPPAAPLAAVPAPVPDPEQPAAARPATARIAEKLRSPRDRLAGRSGPVRLITFPSFSCRGLMRTPAGPVVPRAVRAAHRGRD